MVWLIGFGWVVQWLVGSGWLIDWLVGWLSPKSGVDSKMMKYDSRWWMEKMTTKIVVFGCKITLYMNVFCSFDWKFGGQATSGWYFWDKLG